MPKQYWLMKSEPDEFSIDDLKNNKNQTEGWEGIRNYQARNFIRDDMKINDLAFFYHSNCKQPAIVGVMKIVSKPYPDKTAIDKKSKYYDEKSSSDNIRWVMVDVKFVKKFAQPITLQELKECPELEDFALVRKGNRLSIMPVTPLQYQTIIDMK